VILFVPDQIKDYIGSGGNGKVFLIIDERDKKLKAMKVIELGIAGSKEFENNKKSMDAEFNVGVKLGALNKYLVQITSLFIEGGYCCLIMEFCSGGDFQKILQKKNRIPESVLFLFIYFIYFIFNIYIYLLGIIEINNTCYEWIRYYPQLQHYSSRFNT
jgi:serine/threonine protein kinase